MFFIRSNVRGDITLHSLGCVLPADTWVEIQELTEELKKLVGRGDIEVRRVHPDSFIGKMQQIREMSGRKGIKRDIIRVEINKAIEPDRREQHPVRAAEPPPRLQEVIGEIESEGSRIEPETIVRPLPVRTPVLTRLEKEEEEERPRSVPVSVSVPPPQAVKSRTEVMRDEDTGRQVVQSGDWDF